MKAKLTRDGYAKGAEYTQSIARDGVTYCVSVSKVGGGMIEQMHEGDWMITVTTTRGQVLYDSERLRVDGITTHARVAYMAVDYLHH